MTLFLIKSVVTLVLLSIFICSAYEIKMAIAKTGSKVTVNAMHWFRKGLRLSDNPALVACLEQSPKNIYPVFILDGNSYEMYRVSPLRANFLVECLQDLDNNLRTLGSRLYVLSGDPTVILPERWKEWKITDLSFEEDETGEPYAFQRDKIILDLAETSDVRIFTAKSETLYPLDEYIEKSKNGKAVPSSMTGFQKIFEKMPPMRKVYLAPKGDDIPRNDDLLELSKLYLPPKKPTDLPWPRDIPKSEVEPVWDAHDCKNLTPCVHGGETLARKLLTEKLKDSNWVAAYEKPKTSCTSLKPSTTTLSPYLSLGCISPREVWYRLDEAIEKASVKTVSKPPVSLHGQMLWRDFNNLMAHNANSNHPGCWNRIEGNKYCRKIPWDDDPQLLEAWKKGLTGKFPFGLNLSNLHYSFNS